VKYDFVYVDQESFEKYKPTSFKQVLGSFAEYQQDGSAAVPAAAGPMSNPGFQREWPR
jgi:hypothetical protein